MKLNEPFLKCTPLSLQDQMVCPLVFSEILGYGRTVGADVCFVVQTFLATGEMLQESNLTYLALILKVKDPYDHTQLRPIALCNVVIKFV